MKKKLTQALALLAGILTASVSSAKADRGTYTNPILCFDYSDPDVVRTGEDYWMTASSFNCIPGLPILHSRDLVNWEIVNHALDRLVPEEYFSIPQHGKGVWAPCIKFHDGWYYIYWGDPDFGIYMVKSQDPRSDWTEPVLVKAGKILASLYRNYRGGDACPAFLLHSTGHHPAGSEIDYAIIYADYYYIEALMRLKALGGKE